MPKIDKETIKNMYESGKEKVKDGVEWIVNNPVAAGLIATTLTGLTATTGKIIRSANRNRQEKQETYNKERFIYDHSTGMYLKTKRKLNANDIAKIHALKKSKGWSMTETLMKLDLLE